MTTLRKQKCDKCKGKGGYYRSAGIVRKMFVPCLQCAGRGSWWPNNRPKSAKQKETR